MRVLVVAAHPDDEVLGAGGTLAKHVDAGDEVRAIVVSEGATSRYEDTMVDELRSAGRRSGERIGFASLEFVGMPDQRLDAVALIDVTQALEPLIQDFRPDVLYTHAPMDVNTDHGIVSRAAWTACRPYAAPWLSRFLVFETPSSTEWAWPIAEGSFQPNHFVDVSTTLERKLEAMRCYDEELRPYPHPRSVQALTERASYWGSRVGVTAAEPFMILRSRG
ncbi:PIG-L deacetylase family protein [Nocardioides caricicola]|uniref:PIG-L deacetylase family protein n=1 Tax=Nocardioides caricicola TaxID=634770 RepID=A0ABW0MU68_9ACTN